MSASERRKGASGEREVVAIAREFFPDAAVQRAASGTRQESGDLIRVPGAVVSVKRQEVLRLPLWIREHDPLGAQLGVVPLIGYRTNHGGPAPYWRADMPLRDAFRLLDLARLAG